MNRPVFTSKRILFAPAAGPGVGGGHVMRCLTLAEALTARGAACSFAVNDFGAALIERFSGGTAPIQVGELLSVLETGRFDALVLDDYAMDAEGEHALRKSVGVLIVIDDLANRAHLADLLLDPGYGRKLADYTGLLPNPAKRLLSPAYALVRSAFADGRVTALGRPISPTPQRLFLSFGLSDIDGVACRAVALIRDRLPTINIEVAIASDAQSLPALMARAKFDLGLHLHVDAEDVAALMAGADLAIGAGGASTWERACLGLPTLAVVVADNQREMIKAMAADGMLLAVDLASDDFEQRFDDALADLCSSARRHALRSASANLCDGLGAGRAAEAIMALPVRPLFKA